MTLLKKKNKQINSSFPFKENLNTTNQSANQVAHKGRKGANGRTSDFIARFMYNLQNKDFVPCLINKNNSNVPLPSTLMYIENEWFNQRIQTNYSVVWSWVCVNRTHNLQYTLHILYIIYICLSSWIFSTFVIWSPAYECRFIPAVHYSCYIIAANKLQNDLDLNQIHTDTHSLHFHCSPGLYKPSNPLEFSHYWKTLGEAVNNPDLWPVNPFSVSLACL